MSKIHTKDDQHDGWVNFKKQGFQPSSNSGRPTLPDGKAPASGIYVRHEKDGKIVSRDPSPKTKD